MPRSRVSRIAATLALTATSIAAVNLAGGDRASAATSSRYAGANRYQTAKALSSAHFDPGVDAVYIASGEGFADALAGAPAAAHVGAPLLLTARATLPQATANELTRLEPAEIVVLGGTSAVSDDVLTILEDYTDGGVRRISGSNRWETAAAIATDTWVDGADAVLIANGIGFADALSGGAAGAALDAPILLVGTDALPDATTQAIETLGPAHAQILGGPAAVSTSVRAELGTVVGSIDRWAGQNRYDTSTQIANGAFGHVDTTLLAVGTDYADALAAGAVAGAIGAPVLLAKTDCIPVVVATQIVDMDIETLLVVGGESALSTEVADGTGCDAVPDPLRFTTVYLYPSDEQPLDRDAAIRATLDELNEWMDGETVGRRIRLERNADGVVVVDSLELPFTSAELDPSAEDAVERWPEIYLWLQDLGYITPRQQVAAFVESPGASCGRGGTGLALLWLHTCGSEFGEDDPQQLLSAFAGIMIHEMLHSFGAVPECAPNLDDSEESPSHIDPAASDRDIMFAVYNPFLAVGLDPDRDDYYGHGRLDCHDVVRARYWEPTPA